MATLSFFFALGPPALADCPLSTTNHHTLQQMFTFAERHDETSLAALGDHLPKDRLITDLYPWALWLANHDKYKSRFVNEFPTDLQGFLDLGAYTMEARDDCGIPIRRSITGAYEPLGNYALQGDPSAIRKVIQAKTDGAIAEWRDDIITRSIAAEPHAVLWLCVICTILISS